MISFNLVWSVFAVLVAATSVASCVHFARIARIANEEAAAAKRRWNNPPHVQAQVLRAKDRSKKRVDARYRVVLLGSDDRVAFISTRTNYETPGEAQVDARRDLGVPVTFVPNKG